MGEGKGTLFLQGIDKDDLMKELADIVLSKLEKLQERPAETPQRLLDRKQAAAYLNISLRKLDTLTGGGEIKYSNLSGCVRIRVSELEAYISKKEVRMKKFA